MPPKSNSEVVKKKMSLALVKAKIVRFLTVLNMEDGINSKDMSLLVVEIDFQAESIEDSS